MNERGKIINRERAKQLNDFTGLRFGNITPTDIDAAIEYHNQAYVIIEAKVQGNDLPSGQEIALVRMCDDLQFRKPTILIVANHNTPVDTDVDLSTARVAKVRYKGKWIIRDTTVRELVEKFLSNIDKPNAPH